MVDLGRLAWWLTHDDKASGLVQAMCAVLGLLASIVLVFITAKYVKLTGDLVRAQQAASRSLFLPGIDAKIDWDWNSREILMIHIVNTRSVPFKIISASMQEITLWNGQSRALFQYEKMLRS